MLTTQTETILLQSTIGPAPAAWNKAEIKHTLFDILHVVKYKLQYRILPTIKNTVSYDVSHELK